jgi:serine protease Do
MWLVATTPAGKRDGLTVVHAGKQARVEAILQASSDENGAAPAAPRAVAGKKSPLGMTVSEISPGIARELGNPLLHGVVVMSVEPESPAVEAGVERGDLIVRVAELEVTTLDDYARAVRAVPHGEMIRMLVKRDNKNLWVAFVKR